MADTNSILQRGIEAIRAGERAEARELFRMVTREDPRNAQGWLWLAGAAEDREEKRAALERVMEIEPQNALARKGLSALAGTRTGAAATASPSPSTETTTAKMLQEDDGDGFPARSHARTYEIPQADSPAAAGMAGAQRGPGSSIADGDLQEYYQTPQPQTLASDEFEEPRVVVEDEEPRRGSFAWIPLLLGLGLVLLLLLLLFNQYRSRFTTTAGVTGTGAESTARGRVGAAATGAAASAGVGGTDNVKAVSTAEPTIGGAGGAGQTIATSPAGSETVTPAGKQTILAVATNATVIRPTAVSTSPPATPSAAPMDVAAANPAVTTSPQTVIQAGPWSFTYTGKQNIATGAYGGASPAHGQYQIVLLEVVNNSDQPAKIPDGFFVLKDAQGHVYSFNRAASVDYLSRFGGPGAAADVDANATFPSNKALTSVAFLFDVSPDAKNLVLFSPSNPNQGFLIR